MMTCLRLAGTLLASLFFFTPLAAQPDPPYTLADLMEIASERNPSLAAEQERVQAAEGRLREARNYPNPEITVLQEDTALEARERGGSTKLTVAQPLILGGRRNAAISSAEASLQAARAREQSERRRIRRDIHRIWVELLYLNRKMSLEFSLMEASGETLRQAETRDNKANELRARTDNLEDELDIVSVMAERVFAAQELDYLIGGIGIGPGEVTGELIEGIAPDRLAADREAAIANHPSVQEMASEASASGERARQSLEELTPDLRVGVTAGYDHRSDRATAGVSFTLPIPIWDRNRGERQAYQREADALRSDQERMVLRFESQWATLEQRINEYDTLLTEYSDKLAPAMDEALELAQQEFTGGERDFDDYLSVVRRHHEVHRKRLDYLRLLNLAYVDLEYLSGTE